MKELIVIFLLGILLSLQVIILWRIHNIENAGIMFMSGYGMEIVTGKDIKK